MDKLSEEFIKKLNTVKSKRARCVIDIILKKGFCSTEDLKLAGCEHAPRAARDVRKLGIPLETFKIKAKDGKSIAAYRFGNWDKYKKQNLLTKSTGRTQLSNKLKQLLSDKYGSKCFLYEENYPKQQLQVDRRIPYEILGEQDENDIDNFMLLCPSANRMKSWTCEHCENWNKKNIDICKLCYYAHPEDYSNVAGKEERKLDIIFRKDEIHIYEQLKEIANRESVPIQKAFKKIFKDRN